jgi:hypothetical protein
LHRRHEIDSGGHIGTRDHRPRVLHRLQSFSELFSHAARVDAVANQLRPDENNDFGPLLGVVRIAEQGTEKLDVT